MILPPDKLKPHAHLDAYVFNPDGQDWGNLLLPFSPPLPREGTIILASYFGDVFVEEPSGDVWWLNGLEARVDKVAPNRDAFLRKVDEDHLIMLKTKLLDQLIVGDQLLKAGMLYGLKTPRSQGGKYHPDNVGAAPIADAFAFMGAEFQRRNPQPPPESPAPPPPQPAPKKKGWFN